MADYTTNLHLKKPARTENYNVADANENMDILDAEVGELSKSVEEIFEAADRTIMKDIIYPLLPFEIGTISIKGTGWEWQNNTKRIRTPEDKIFSVKVGDVIKLNDYENYRMYIGILEEHGYHTSGGWLSNDYEVLYDGMCVMIVARYTETVLQSVEELANAVSLERINTFSNRIEKIEEKIPTVDNIKSVVEIPTYPFDIYSIHGISHRGVQYEAPENTIFAFIKSVQNGFKFVETDVQLTSDKVPILIHDTTVDRTTNGTGNVKDFTFAQIRELDAGSWFNTEYPTKAKEEYVGAKIPSFEEFIVFCKRTNIFPYLELKSETTYTQEDVQIIIDILKKYDFLHSVSWISMNMDYLHFVTSIDKMARVGYVKASDISASAVTALNELYTGYNRIFWSCSLYDSQGNRRLSNAGLLRAKNAGQTVNIGVVSTEQGIIDELDYFADSDYFSGCLSNGTVNFADIVKERALLN